MAKCLVLGSNGFLGSHLVDSLVACGHSVRAFDRLSKVKNYTKSDQIEEFNGDFLNRNDLASALDGVEYLFHFISTTTPITADADPLIDIETNIRMSVVLFEEAVNRGVKKVIFASTSSLYGLNLGRPLRETDTPEPISPYTIGKLTIEHYLRYFKVKHGLNSVSFRISNPYGERQPLRRKQGVIPIFMEQIYNDEPVTVLGDGTMVRDYIYVKDVTDMISLAFEKDTERDIYNLGSGKGESVNEILQNIATISGKAPQIVHKPTPATFVQRVVLDTSEFQSHFGLTPQTSLEEGMRATWEYVAKSHLQKDGL